MSSKTADQSSPRGKSSASNAPAGRRQRGRVAVVGQHSLQQRLEALHQRVLQNTAGTRPARPGGPTFPGSSYKIPLFYVRENSSTSFPSSINGCLPLCKGYGKAGFVRKLPKSVDTPRKLRYNLSYILNAQMGTSTTPPYATPRELPARCKAAGGRGAKSSRSRRGEPPVAAARQHPLPCRVLFGDPLEGACTSCQKEWYRRAPAGLCLLQKGERPAVLFLHPCKTAALPRRNLPQHLQL